MAGDPLRERRVGVDRDDQVVPVVRAVERPGVGPPLAWLQLARDLPAAVLVLYGHGGRAAAPVADLQGDGAAVRFVDRADRQVGLVVAGQAPSERPEEPVG